MSSALRTRNILALLGAFVVTSMAGGVLAAGLAMPAVGASGVLTKNSVTFFDSLPAELAQPPLSEKTRLLASDGSLITSFFEENRDIQPLSKIALPLQQAVIAIEDSRFYDHGGVDPHGLARAAVVNQISGSVAQGASTLTQQYVKNVLVQTANVAGDDEAKAAATEGTATRKIQEIRLAVSLEQELTKEEILERYLNVVWFGGKVNGIEAASRYYFRTTAEKLTLAQAATLAGMIQSPPRHSPEKNPEASVKRRNVVLARMLELGMIDQATFDKTKAEKLGAKITPIGNGCANAAGQYHYYCEYVRQLILKSDDFAVLGKTEEEREKALMRGGLTIKTALDPKIMKAAWKALSETIPPDDKSKVASASVTIEPGTGKVLSIQQNKTYDPSTRDGGRDSINYSVDNKWGGGQGFQPGSTFKPITLAEWLKQGKSLNASLPAAGGSASFSAFKSCNPEYSRSQVYNYGNAGDGYGDGNMSVWDGTAGSVNGVYVSMLKQLNLCDVRETAEDLGIYLAKPRLDSCTTKENDMTNRIFNCFPSMTLGNMDVSPMTMAGAYAAFAAEGEYCQPLAILSIQDRDGKEMKIPGERCTQALDKGVANTVTLALSRVFSSGGTAASLGGLPGGRPASGKTGTTNNSVDTWFAGYTPQLATAVWVGDPFTYKTGNDGSARKTLNNRTINGVRRGGVYGATFAGAIWKDIMVEAVKGTEIKRFKSADPRLTRVPRTAVPSVNGQSVDSARRTLERAGFSVEVANDPVRSEFPQGSVASTAPGGGSRASTGSQVTIRISAGGGGGGGGGDDNDSDGRGQGGFFGPDDD